MFCKRKTEVTKIKPKVSNLTNRKCSDRPVRTHLENSNFYNHDWTGTRTKE